MSVEGESGTTGEGAGVEGDDGRVNSSESGDKAACWGYEEGNGSWGGRTGAEVRG